MAVTTTNTGDQKLKLSLRARRSKGVAHMHPVNQLHHDEATFGERLADTIIAVGIWLVGNAILFFHFDPKPFILLNLVFSVQAAYTGPVLLLAGNRQAQKDRLTLEHACAEADKADLQNVQILKAIEQNTEATLTILRHVETMVSERLTRQIL
jgi:uncharacterized membrane protein